MYIDTNYILRYLLNDIPEQAQKASDVIAEGCNTYPEVIPEVIYVLNKIYGIDRKQVSAVLLNLLDDISIERKEQIKEALSIYADTKFDYVDCILLAGFSKCGEDFLSFDKKLMNRKKNNKK